MYPSRIVPAMRRTAFLLAVALVSAVPLCAQTTEFGFMYGGSKRVIKGSQTPAPNTSFDNSSFSFSNSAFDLYYAVQLEPGTMFKLQVGRIDTPIAVRETASDGTTVRRDVDGQVQHAEGIVEYRFSEPYGSTGLFAGVGAYRHTASNFGSEVEYGFPIGVDTDFPLSRRYGIIAAATYHFTNAAYRPRYLTIGAGLRFSF